MNRGQRKPKPIRDEGDLPFEIGTKVKAARESKGCTQRGLGAKTGLSPNYLSRLECGTKNASLETLDLIAKVLGFRLHVEFKERVQTLKEYVNEANQDYLRDRPAVKVKPHHETRKIMVHGKEVDVDIEIIPVVEWINNLGGRTIYSCEGGRIQNPYVLFRAESDALEKILAKVEEYHCFARERNRIQNIIFTYQSISFEADWQDGVRYKMYFFDENSTKNFIVWLGSTST